MLRRQKNLRYSIMKVYSNNKLKNFEFEYYIYYTGKQLEKIPTCTFEGKIFRHGEIIYPRYPPCFKCACNKHFTNTTVATNKNCRRVNCNIAFESFDKIQSECAPIYYGDEQCCPFKYRCRKYRHTNLDSFWSFLYLRASSCTAMLTQYSFSKI